MLPHDPAGDETTDQVITSGNPVSVGSFALKITQPT
jgi:hypothetical protein